MKRYPSESLIRPSSIRRKHKRKKGRNVREEEGRRTFDVNCTAPMGEEEDGSLPPSLSSYHRQRRLIRSALSAEPLARRMTMEVDNNGGRKRTLARGRGGGRGGRRLERIEARSWSGGKEEKGVNVEGEREGRRQKIRQRKIVVGSFV